VAILVPFAGSPKNTRLVKPQCYPAPIKDKRRSWPADAIPAHPKPPERLIEELRRLARRTVASTRGHEQDRIRLCGVGRTRRRDENRLVVELGPPASKASTVASTKSL
jgi:hypothetical protein